VLHFKRSQHQLFCLLHHLGVEVVWTGRAQHHGDSELEHIVLAWVAVNPPLPELKAMSLRALQQ